MNTIFADVGEKFQIHYYIKYKTNFQANWIKSRESGSTSALQLISSTTLSK